ncbi:MAG: acyl-[ACP]--phospholipid O-acyltransferase [Pirellulaceae bacterium]|jgi:acyl-[acyl-carrier-protein]-phospholipid O-acyltransferase/long-chain-fatty-acid--[acyl-carrier-protein] ligase|nr:acyl-[ACP]--phospholipid O-acyltransferase [Pirellulaceae bacterium]MDP7015353.1 acyl-[ACP]--phospholipid O-acyltransferase [Pirellulaceae bacterium]
MPTDTAQASESRDGLWSTSFLGLLFTQLLTAVNDNVFRWLAVGIGKDYVEQDSLILMAGTACFVLPYLLLAAPAGYLADRYSKRTVIVGCKVAEIVIMGLGVAAIVMGSLQMLFVVVALMGAQSALFSPAKLGSIPEILKSDRISAANGLFGLTTVSATVIGMGLGSWLSDRTGDRGLTDWWISAAVLLGISVVGFFFSLIVRKLKPANITRTFPWNAATQTFRDLQSLWSRRALFRVALGIVFFWAVGAFAQLNIDQFAFEGGAQGESDKTPLLAALVFGVGLGSVLAGVASRGRVELGILPLGAGGVAISAMLLFTAQGPIIQPEGVSAGFIWASVLLCLLGVSAGLFSVPLEAYMQHNSPVEQRGSVLAAANFLVFSGVFVSAIAYYVLRLPLLSEEPLMSARQIFLLTGVTTVPVLIYIVWLIPQATIRFLVWLASITVYRIRVYGRENLPAQGGAILTPNHVSWLDGVLLLLTSSRPVRMIVYADNFTSRWMKYLANLWGAILIMPRPKAIVAALNEAAEALDNGELVCIFPEGGITRSGQMQTFKGGVMKILKKTKTAIPVVPVYLDGLWGSIFSFEGGKFFWKRPKRWPFPLSIHYGPPVAQPDGIQAIRQAVEHLGADAVRQRAERTMVLSRSFIRRCKQRKRGVKISDSTGVDISGGMVLMRTLILRRLLRRHVLSGDEQYVGVLLPPSNGGVIVNAALAIDRRISVNLNYTVSSEVLNECIAQAGIKHVLTSRKFMERMKFELDAEVVYLEDFKDQPTLGDKISAGFHAYIAPAGWLERSLKLRQVTNDDVMTVIFTSGSTGTPKGVMLTYGNVASNTEAINQVVHLTSQDVLVGVLPFFHSFGFTVTLWTVLSMDIRGAYHFNPLDARQVGKLCLKHGGTLLLATPTFLRTYLRRCTEEEFKTLDVVVAGAEKLATALSDAFEEKFRVRPSEGYGATELSPLVSVNIPASRDHGEDEINAKEGSVGRPVPGVTAKIVDRETGEILPAGESGMLLIKGPNVMKGYLGRDDLTAEVIDDGWYCTGDVAVIDEDGFIFITGRESRFSKIGGEMAPHILIEETLNEIIGAGEDAPLQAAVTAVPDEKKGERLVVLHLPIDKSVDELRAGLTERGLPNIFIPAANCFFEVEELPMLGSGKLDLKALAKMAEEKTK